MINSIARVRPNLNRAIPMSKNKRFAEIDRYVTNNNNEISISPTQNIKPIFMTLLIFLSMCLKLSMNCLTILKSFLP